MDLLEFLVTPLLMVLGGIIAWFIKSKREELLAIEKRLMEERRNVYLKLLDPYFSLFSDPTGKGKTDAIKKIVSYDYRKTAFESNLFASDEVINAYNNLLSHAYEAEKTGEQDPEKMLRLFGNLVLEIRKNLGNKKTKLNEIDMLKGMIKDIEKING